MNKKFRIVIGACFLLGAGIFGIIGEFAYVPIFLFVGGIYIYKGVR